MSFLRRKSDGAVTDRLQSDSVEYQKLAGLRDSTGVNTLWEDIPEEDLAGVTSRVMVFANPGAAIAADETVGGKRPERSGTITAASVVADAPGIVGAATNSRTITVQAVSVSGTTSPTRAVTTLCTLALVAGVNAPAGQPSTAMTINSASLSLDTDVEVVSTHIGTGIVDPGGLVLVTYTPS